MLQCLGLRCLASYETGEGATAGSLEGRIGQMVAVNVEFMPAGDADLSSASNIVVLREGAECYRNSVVALKEAKPPSEERASWSQLYEALWRWQRWNSGGMPLQRPSGPSFTNLSLVACGYCACT
eukprot:NODE_12006_length_527_cov_65.460396_g11718_i0.p1 GENE.NODE_12006_length_527_cov_65.460396_g11718_i0~~NODE_12006_length_527_cov_65.460396_g11718_i0.p1  ORF type:complete len:141 (-),score=27.92 NODE_12006_length_527_cov_65.460396_g11718_i0:103-477(-)